MANVDEHSESVTQQDMSRLNVSAARSYFAIGILLVINLVNLMDRYIIAGMLNKVQVYFGIHDRLTGLLQTVPTCSYLALAPLFGYLGDRYNRKILMGVGIVIWSTAMLAGSFVTGFWLLNLCLAFVGVGQASFATIAPTVIADLFVDAKRTWALCAFYTAIPIGSGLGYILGSSMLKLTDDWHWGLRVTPCIGALNLLLLAFLMPNPHRGASENLTEALNSRTSWYQDLKYLMTNWSFMLSTLGFATVAFTSGVLGFWGPVFLERVNRVSSSTENSVYCKDSLLFGAIVCSSGIFAILIGAMLSKTLRSKNAQADPIICAVGMLLSAPFFYFGIMFADKSMVATFVCIFFGELFIGLTWIIVSDILLYVVIPSRRSLAEAVQITISRVLGDAFSSYIVGEISNALQEGRQLSTYRMFVSLQYALLICPFMVVIGAALFFCTARHLKEDQTNTVMYIQGNCLQLTRGSVFSQSMDSSEVVG
ncbi:protein spinster homolog 1-like isoform X2 [Hypanus sabinus]|uniref:protein spinster homolog 1-like isoform X2 n=1 Tax=Hypanus sabinus TaxID=79690 RepID=UPI0028C381E9|nr:protein spinster homolog 1-like isoform X2 [Hypanus sabinus]